MATSINSNANTNTEERYQLFSNVLEESVLIQSDSQNQKTWQAKEHLPLHDHSFMRQFHGAARAIQEPTTAIQRHCGHETHLFTNSLKVFQNQQGHIEKDVLLQNPTLRIKILQRENKPNRIVHTCFDGSEANTSSYFSRQMEKLDAKTKLANRFQEQIHKGKLKEIEEELSHHSVRVSMSAQNIASHVLKEISTESAAEYRSDILDIIWYLEYYSPNLHDQFTNLCKHYQLKFQSVGHLESKLREIQQSPTVGQQFRKLVTECLPCLSFSQKTTSLFDAAFSSSDISSLQQYEILISGVISSFLEFKEPFLSTSDFFDFLKKEINLLQTAGQNSFVDPLMTQLFKNSFRSNLESVTGYIMEFFKNTINPDNIRQYLERGLWQNDNCDILSLILHLGVIKKSAFVFYLTNTSTTYSVTGFFIDDRMRIMTGVELKDLAAKIKTDYSREIPVILFNINNYWSTAIVNTPSDIPICNMQQLSYFQHNINMMKGLPLIKTIPISKYSSNSSLGRLHFEFNKSIFNAYTGKLENNDNSYLTCFALIAAYRGFAQHSVNQKKIYPQLPSSESVDLTEPNTKLRANNISITFVNSSNVSTDVFSYQLAFSLIEKEIPMLRIDKYNMPSRKGLNVYELLCNALLERNNAKPDINALMDLHDELRRQYNFLAIKPEFIKHHQSQKFDELVNSVLKHPVIEFKALVIHSFEDLKIACHYLEKIEMLQKQSSDEFTCGSSELLAEQRNIDLISNHFILSKVEHFFVLLAQELPKIKITPFMTTVKHLRRILHSFSMSLAVSEKETATTHKQKALMVKTQFQMAVSSIEGTNGTTKSIEVALTRAVLENLDCSLNELSITSEEWCRLASLIGISEFVKGVSKNVNAVQPNDIGGICSANSSKTDLVLASRELDDSARQKSQYLLTSLNEVVSSSPPSQALMLIKTGAIDVRKLVKNTEPYQKSAVQNAMALNKEKAKTAFLSTPVERMQAKEISKLPIVAYTDFTHQLTNQPVERDRLADQPVPSPSVIQKFPYYENGVMETCT